MGCGPWETISCPRSSKVRFKDGMKIDETKTRAAASRLGE